MYLESLLQKENTSHSDQGKVKVQPIVKTECGHFFHQMCADKLVAFKNSKNDSDEEDDLIGVRTKRLREHKRRTGQRRSRACVIDSEEDEENVELLRRGATKIDCKRVRGYSGIS